MRETPYQTADAGVSPSDSECRSISIRQGMQESLYQTANAGDSLSETVDAGDQTADAGDSLSDRCRVSPHPLSGEETPASAV